MKLYILRHGETQWNVQKRLQGASDTELNENGIILAEKTGEALQEIPFYCCFTSPLKRAKDTASWYFITEKFLSMRIREYRKFALESGRERIPPCFLRICFIIFFIIQRIIKHRKEEKSLLIFVPEPETSGRILQPEKNCRTKIFSLLLMAVQCVLFCRMYMKMQTLQIWHGKVPPNCSVNIVEIKENKAILLEEDVVYYVR